MTPTIRRLATCSLLLALLPLLAGCPAVDRKGPSQAATKGHGHAHAHPDEGPHGGALAEWGDEKYHAEFTVDHGKKQATVYVLDGSAKKAAPIDAKELTLSLSNVKPAVQVTLKADPQEGDPKGQSSRFTGTHDALGKEMEFEGEISGKVGETPYSGEFKEKAHEHRHEDKGGKK